MVPAFVVRDSPLGRQYEQLTEENVFDKNDATRDTFSVRDASFTTKRLVHRMLGGLPSLSRIGDDGRCDTAEWSAFEVLFGAPKKVCFSESFGLEYLITRR